MDQFLLILHSWLRWVVIILAAVALYKNYTGWQSERKFTSADSRINTFFIASLHTQLLIGLIMYFATSPVAQTALGNMKAAMADKELRFWGVEHITGMIIGVVVAQIGSIRSKKQHGDTSKFRTAFTWFLIAIVIIILMIPFGIWNVDRPLFRF
jgi:uncharacterized protein YacL